jgi:hypothetical protein
MLQHGAALIEGDCYERYHSTAERDRLVHKRLAERDLAIEHLVAAWKCYTRDNDNEGFGSIEEAPEKVLEEALDDFTRAQIALRRRASFMGDRNARICDRRAHSCLEERGTR